MNTTQKSFKEDVISHLNSGYIVKLHNVLETITVKKKYGDVMINGEYRDILLEEYIEKLYSRGFNEFTSF